MNPIGIRRDKLGEYVGSERIARDMIAAGWLAPIVSQPKLVLFATSDIAKAFSRLRAEIPERAYPKRGKKVKPSNGISE